MLDTLGLATFRWPGAWMDYPKQSQHQKCAQDSQQNAKEKHASLAWHKMFHADTGE